MDKTAYTNLAKAWQFAEERAAERMSRPARELREEATAADVQLGSTAQAAFLTSLTALTGASSVIAVGTGNVGETVALVEGLEGKGQLTAVDSSADGIEAIRHAFARLDDEEGMDTTLRAVNAAAGVFLPRLNGDDYDLIVVAGEAANYTGTLAQAPRLLRAGGALVLLDALAFEADDAKGGVLNPADRSDKAVAMRELLDKLDEDEEFTTTMIPVGTGLVIARRG